MIDYMIIGDAPRWIVDYDGDWIAFETEEEARAFAAEMGLV